MLDYLPPQVRSQVHSAWRRRWLALGVAGTLCTAGWLAVSLLPDQYRAWGRIYVDTESTLGPLLKNIAVESDLRRQVDVMQRTLLSRTNLARVAQETKLDDGTLTLEDQERLYDRLARRVEVKAEAINLFLVGYENPDPVLAKDVVQALVQIFVDSNIGQNQADMGAARVFIENQIADYETKLKEAESRLAEFKASHVGIFGGGSGAVGDFTLRVQNAHAEVARARRAHSDAVIRRDQIRGQLAQVPQFLDISGNQYRPPNIDPLGDRIIEAQRNLDDLLLRFTEQHPDVRMARQLLAALQAERRGRGPGGGRHDQISNAVYEQLKVRLVEAETELATSERHVREAEIEAERLSEMASIAPSIEAQFADLNRDYGVMKKQFEELLARRESARISQAVESTGDSVKFRIVEAPAVPALPSGPPRRLFLAVVLLLALGGGAGFAYMIGRSTDAIETPEALAVVAGRPVLGAVAVVETQEDRQRRASENRRFGLATAGLLLVFGVLMAIADHLSLGSVLLPQETMRLLSQMRM